MKYSNSLHNNNGGTMKEKKLISPLSSFLLPLLQYLWVLLLGDGCSNCLILSYTGT